MQHFRGLRGGGAQKGRPGAATVQARRVGSSGRHGNGGVGRPDVSERRAARTAAPSRLSVLRTLAAGLAVLLPPSGPPSLALGLLLTAPAVGSLGTDR